MKSKVLFRLGFSVTSDGGGPPSAASKTESSRSNRGNLSPNRDSRSERRRSNTSLAASGGRPEVCNVEPRVRHGRLEPIQLIGQLVKQPSLAAAADAVKRLHRPTVVWSG